MKGLGLARGGITFPAALRTRAFRSKKGSLAWAEPGQAVSKPMTGLQVQTLTLRLAIRDDCEGWPTHQYLNSLLFSLCLALPRLPKLLCVVPAVRVASHVHSFYP